MTVNIDDIVRVGDEILCNYNKQLRFIKPIDEKNNRLWRVDRIIYRADNPCDALIELTDFYRNTDRWSVHISEVGKYVFFIDRLNKP